MNEQGVVIVGHGAAGLAAAVTAAETAREGELQAKITVVERAPEGAHGGGSRWSPCYMRMRSVDEVAPGFEADIQRDSGGAADAAYFRRLAAEAPGTVTWLERRGVEFHQPTYYLSAGPPRIQPIGGGIAVVRALTAVARRLGVTFAYQREASELVMREGSVAGVKLASGETLDADCVVLASGGFEGDPALMREHIGVGAEAMRAISPGGLFNTGGGIRMALQAGAQRAGDWNGMHAEPVDARCTEPAPVVLVYPYGIVVDRRGKRFFDEGAGLVHETWEHFARRIQLEAPGRVAYAILDSALRDIPDYGRAIRSTVPPVEAGTIAELAAKLGIQPAALEQTVSEFNAAASGDAARFDFSRADGLATALNYQPPKSNWARPLAKPPFLAWPLVGAVAYTFGGVATNDEAEVLGASGPIRGLYAAGEITGHFHGTAPNAVAMLRALVFGRIAGRNAIQ